MVKKIIIILNLLLALSLVYKFIALQKHWEEDQQARTVVPNFTQAKINRPVTETLPNVSTIFGMQPLFDSAEAGELGDHDQSPDQLVTNDSIIRVQGIFTRDAARWAVVSITPKNSRAKDKEEFIKVKPADQVGTFQVGSIAPKTVTLSSQDGSTVQLRIFKKI